MTRIVLVGVLTSIAAIVGILVLIRTRRLQERFAILWLLAAAGIVILGLWTDALGVLADVMGIAYPPSALFLIVSAFVLIVLLHSAVVLSRLSGQSQTLAQRLAMLEERMHRLEGGEEPAAAAAGAADEAEDEAGATLPSGPRRLA